MNGIHVYHVTRTYAGWAIQDDGRHERGGAYADKGTALRHGQEMARQVRGRLVVHREDGSIQAEHRY